MVAGITVKIGRFLLSASACWMPEQSKSTINFEDVITGKKILICNFSICLQAWVADLYHHRRKTRDDGEGVCSKTDCYEHTPSQTEFDILISMKGLSLSRPMVMIIVGIPGAGKSHFARQFADVFQTPLVSFDKIRHMLFSEPSFTKDEELLVASLMNDQIQELYKTKKSFIVDGAVNSKMARAEIERSARKHDYSYLTIWVQTDADSSKYRSVTRNARRAGDAYNTAMTEDQFTNMAKRINPPHGNEHYVVISGKHTFATQAKIVLQKIVAPRQAAAPISRSSTQRPGVKRILST